MKPQLLLIGSATARMMDRLNAEFVVHRIDEIADMPAFLSKTGPEITCVSTNGHAGVPADIMAGLPNLKMVSCYGVGYDAVDTKTAVERGIVVTHTPNVLNAEVANTAIMLMLALKRDLRANDAYVRAGKWLSDGNAPLSRSAEKQTVGILGLGRIGEAIAEKLQVFDANVVYHSRTEKDVPYTYYGDLTQMASDADVLICITPGGAATRGLVNREVLDALGADGMLINVSRGSVVDEPELVKALQEGRLGSAGLDVFDVEPNVPAELMTMENVILLPHVGSATVETRQAMGDLTCDNLSQFLRDGTTLTPVPECKDL